MKRFGHILACSRWRIRPNLKRFSLFAFFIAVGLPSHAQTPEPTKGEYQADKPGKIYATAWGLTLAEDGTGFFNDLARLTFGDIANEGGYEIVPYRRGNRIFIQDPTACHYSSSLNYMTTANITNDTSTLLESSYVIRSIAHVFSRYGEQPLTSEEGAYGKTIAYPMGAELPHLLQSWGANFLAVNNEVNKAEILINKRVDLMIAYMPDTKLVFDYLGRNLPPYDPKFTINDDHIAIVCHRTRGNINLMERINTRIQMIKENGELTAFLERHGINPQRYIVP